jgi:hypothetical protein
VGDRRSSFAGIFQGEEVSYRSGLGPIQEAPAAKNASAGQSKERYRMKCSEAREVLLLYRPSIADAADPRVAEALELAGRDPELGRWFDQHSAFQKAMRAKFQQIEVPAHLKASLLMRGLRSRRSSLARSGGAARSG